MFKPNMDGILENQKEEEEEEEVKVASEINVKLIKGHDFEYTVDGLKLKDEHVQYYATLKVLIDSIVTYISKELNMQQYGEVYSLGRQLYELLRGIFIDEPFKRWLKNNEKRFNDSFHKKIISTIQLSLKNILLDKHLLKKQPFKQIVLESLNKEFHSDILINLQEYVRPECIVTTYNCCKLNFKHVRSCD
jgi:hypothetical protein